MSRQAIGRQTDGASVLESFLDDESDNLSNNIFDGLEEVAKDIEEIENELLEELQSVNDDKEDLVNEIERLEKQIEELEESE